MGSAVAEYGVAVAEGERPAQVGWNWGLLLALGFCLVFWLAVVLGIAAVI